MRIPLGISRGTISPKAKPHGNSGIVAHSGLRGRGGTGLVNKDHQIQWLGHLDIPKPLELTVPTEVLSATGGAQLFDIYPPNNHLPLQY